ncbi:hypothetical protein BKA67DRAFT_573109 [Truncatella angustata]|uniref:Uncharacterized protein n=1 Tax=Truncatella angustata TaxID=152316 RepID=A0A9P8UH74_9PEZI|nr:uncharacterized protein BKA67DRAFT_573109 [Truncatella angustata]KAH6652135.1 hypothetical protein BKA67DRAFT_573109 [Truncatella angustata]KAH8205047.1 hypothetical protein TruAng_000770 [Truncatella angustata]
MQLITLVTAVFCTLATAQSPLTTTTVTTTATSSVLVAGSTTTSTDVSVSTTTTVSSSLSTTNPSLTWISSSAAGNAQATGYALAGLAAGVAAMLV